MSFESGYNKLRCLENHDTSRAADRFPERKKLLAWTALNYFMKGTILLYAGQEVCEKHTPSLFEKEPVDWNSGEDISGYLAKLAAIKKKLPTDELFRIGADDTQGIVTASYIGPATRAVGGFRWRATAAPWPYPAGWRLHRCPKWQSSNSSRWHADHRGRSGHSIGIK